MGSRQSAAETTAGLRPRLERLVRALSEGLVERDTAVRLVLLAALAGEHVLLIGPPGTAKSQLARRLQRCLTGGAYFERLLTRFSVPEELFGPLSIQRLERDEYHRLTDGYLPTATVAFLDEVFKANSAILNALLTLLNEREFDNGTRREHAPLVTVVGATNELPEGEELAALYDRFLFRVAVDAVSDEGFEALLAAPTELPEIAAEDRFEAEELDALRRRASEVIVPPSVRDVLGHLRRRLRDRALYVSDRRFRQLVGAMRVAALCEDRRSVSLSDVWICEHGIWTDPAQQEAAAAALREAIDEVLIEEPKRFGVLSTAFQTQLRREHEAKAPVFDGEGQPLFVGEDGNATRDGRGAACRFLAPRDHRGTKRGSHSAEELWEEHFRHLPDGMSKLEAWTTNPAAQVRHRTRDPIMGPKQYDAAHVERRREQLALIRDDVERFRDGLERIREPASLWISVERLAAHAEAAEVGLARIQALEPLLDELQRLATSLPVAEP